MSDLVPTEDIEEIVGQQRHNVCHYGRAVSTEQTVYILHSWNCLDLGIDLRECEYSIALDRGIIQFAWQGFEDEAVVLYIEHGRVFPLGHPRPGASPKPISVEDLAVSLGTEITEYQTHVLRQFLRAKHHQDQPPAVPDRTQRPRAGYGITGVVFDEAATPVLKHSKEDSPPSRGTDKEPQPAQPRARALAAKQRQGKGPPSPADWRGRERTTNYRSQS